MPPFLNIYALTKHRNLPTIERFLDTYVDRAASEDRADEELMLVSLVAHKTLSEPETSSDWDWEPARTLSHTITRGLEYPRRGFTVYLKSKDKNIERAILTFTIDDLLVLGLSLDDAGKQAENEQWARTQMSHLVDTFGGHLGMICVEQPPPLLERTFRQREDAPLTVCFWKSEPRT